jgi:hypothetical protein
MTVTITSTATACRQQQSEGYISRCMSWRSGCPDVLSWEFNTTTTHGQRQRDVGMQYILERWRLQRQLRTSEIEPIIDLYGWTIYKSENNLLYNDSRQLIAVLPPRMRRLDDVASRTVPVDVISGQSLSDVRSRIDRFIDMTWSISGAPNDVCYFMCCIQSRPQRTQSQCRVDKWRTLYTGRPSIGCTISHVVSCHASV